MPGACCPPAEGRDLRLTSMYSNTFYRLALLLNCNDSAAFGGCVELQPFPARVSDWCRWQGVLLDVKY